ncbi:MAG TPA: hypothetical protein VK588_08825 [Chitinophagaceae bacterium]|nr:hypothetical protein [Chitinophagaceae bacterium]
MTPKNKKIVQTDEKGTGYPDIPYIGKLLHNTNISPSVYHAYCALIPKAEQGKVPFSYCIYGAYPLTLDWEMLQLKIKNKTEPFNKVSEKQIDKAYHDFANGFKEGYYSFENDKINSKLFKDDTAKAQVIFDIATSWLLTDRGFGISHGEGVGYFGTWKNAGKEGGYYYRAWYLILENHSVFAPIFSNAPAVRTISYSSENTITVQDTAYYFPFDCYNTCRNIMLLDEELRKPTVSALTIQFYPDLIFDENFTGHYDYAAIVSNIIQTLAEDAINTVHKGGKRKEKLLDWLVSECEKRALQFKVNNSEPEQKQQETPKQQSYKSLIDDNNYSPNIEDFKEKALIESLDKSNPANYLKFLRGEKERYTNTIFYYNTYGNSEAENILQNSYSEILAFINSEISQRLGAENLKSENNDIQTFDEIIKQENKFWKGIPMGIVVNHFKVLSERNSRNGKPFLTVEQLVKFFEKGFLGKAKIKKQKINISNGEKGFVIKRFYEFFELAVSNYSELNKKAKYISLISTCFDNWEHKSIVSFFKPNKAKENW